MADINWGNTRAPAQTPYMGTAAPTGTAHSGHMAGYPAHPQSQGYVDHTHHAAPQAHGYPYAAPPAQMPSHVAAQGPHADPYQTNHPTQMGSGQYAPNNYAPMQGGAAPTGGRTPSGFGALANYAGAAVSLALVAGLAVWGYQLAVRDVSGIPVVRALEGPMRVQPVDPGGSAAAHQGLAVNAVQASGEASGPSDRVALAPAPDALEAEDQPVNSAAAVQETPQTPVLEPIDVAMETTVSATPTAAIDVAALPVDPVAAALAIAEQISQNIQPLSETGAEVTRISAPSPSVAPLVAGPKIIPASVPGVRQSPRPVTRPANLPTVAPQPASLTAPVATTTAEVTADAIPAGTRLVQLGAFDSEDVARTEWGKLSDRFEDYIPGKTRVIQKAKSGGKTFYRLRAMGFKDLADARRFCSALMAGKAACIPVVTR